MRNIERFEHHDIFITYNKNYDDIIAYIDIAIYDDNKKEKILYFLDLLENLDNGDNDILDVRNFL
jgi:hypothetical protein